RRCSAAPWRPTSSQRITVGSVNPWPTRVMMMTPKVANRIMSRCGNGSPLAIVRGVASAAASDTTPRTPGEGTTNGSAHGASGGAPGERRNQPARQIGRGVYPDKAGGDRDRCRERGRHQQLPDGEVVGLLDQRSGLQAGHQEHKALDQVDGQVPEEDALQAG